MTRPDGWRQRRARGPRGSPAHKIWVPLRAQTQVRGRSTYLLPSLYTTNVGQTPTFTLHTMIPIYVYIWADLPYDVEMRNTITAFLTLYCRDLLQERRSK